MVTGKCQKNGFHVHFTIKLSKPRDLGGLLYVNEGLYELMNDVNDDMMRPVHIPPRLRCYQIDGFSY